MFETEINDSVATLRLADGKVNAMNIEWCQQFDESDAHCK